MTNSNTPVVSKMTLARTIFQEIFAKGYKLPEGKTQRAHFIVRAVEEIPMSQHGAATYYQNLSNEANGQKTYKYNKPTKKATSKVTKEVVAKMEEVVLALTHQVTERWMCVNQSGYEVNSFKTRTQAQSFAKDNGLKWKDRNAA